MINHFAGSFVIKLLELGFQATMFYNKERITFRNSKGNTVYFDFGNVTPSVNCFKQTASCYQIREQLLSEEKVQEVVNTIKEKLKL